MMMMMMMMMIGKNEGRKGGGGGGMGRDVMGYSRSAHQIFFVVDGGSLGCWGGGLRNGKTEKSWNLMMER